MNVNLEYSYSATAVIIGLFIITYFIYGRIKKKPLVGNFKPGSPDYAVFINLIAKTKYLVIASIITFLFSIKLVFDIIAVLQHSSSKSILIFIPFVAVSVLFITAKLGPTILGKK